MTPVVFRRWPAKEGGDVIALFPTLDLIGWSGLCQSYQRVGQHGGADYRGVVRITRPATPAEYAALILELVQIGYLDLKVYRRFTPKRIKS